MASSTSHSYTMEFKLDAVHFGNHKAAEKFGVARKRIIEWKKNSDVIACVKKSRKRNEGGGRKPLDEGMEENLAEWIHDRRAKGLCVSGKLVCAKAKNIIQEIDPKGDPRHFVASHGWLQKFMNRHSLSLQAKTLKLRKIHKGLSISLLLLSCTSVDYVNVLVISTEISSRWTKPQFGRICSQALRSRPVEQKLFDLR